MQFHESTSLILYVLLRSGAAVRGFRRSHRSGRSIEASAVVPKNFVFVRIGQRELQKAFHCMGISRVAVRIVGRENQLVAAEFLNGVTRGRFVRLYGDEALALEIFARRHGEIGHENVAFSLVALVEAPQKPRQPRAGRFEKDDTKFGMALANAAAENTHRAHHSYEVLPIDAA